MKTNVVRLVFLTMAVFILAGLVAQPCSAQFKAPGAKIDGMGLGDWLETYWRWYYTPASPPVLPQEVGNVTLLPLPASTQVSGSWTPEDPAILQGSIDIPLRVGRHWVVPFVAWTCERYNNGTPSDIPPTDAAFKTFVTSTLVTLDGATVVTDANFYDWFVSREPNPEILYSVPSWYGSVATWYFQSVGVIGKPLPKGSHTLTLYEVYVIPPGVLNNSPGGFAVIYDNTFKITVR